MGVVPTILRNFTLHFAETFFAHYTGDSLGSIKVNEINSFKNQQMNSKYMVVSTPVGFHVGSLSKLNWNLECWFFLGGRRTGVP